MLCLTALSPTPSLPQDQAKQAAAAASSSSGGDRAASGSSSALSLEAEFNIYADRHAGQFALRRLYHESDRLLAVLYTGGWACGRRMLGRGWVGEDVV